MRFMKGSWESLWSVLIDRTCYINEGIQDIRKVLFDYVKLDQLTACLKFLKPISLGCHFFEGDEASALCVISYLKFAAAAFPGDYTVFASLKGRGKENPQVPRK